MVEIPVTGLSADNSSPTTLGQTTTLTATVMSGENVLYNWDFGDGQGGSGPVVNHTYPDARLYSAVVTASNSVSVDTAETIVAIEADVSIAKSGPALVAAERPITYTLTITNSTSLTLTGVFISDTLPTGASYLCGGTLIGDVVRAGRFQAWDRMG